MNGSSGYDEDYKHLVSEDSISFITFHVSIIFINVSLIKLESMLLAKALFDDDELLLGEKIRVNVV